LAFFGTVQIKSPGQVNQGKSQMQPYLVY